MRFIVDAMGGDNAPEQIVLGSIQALQEDDQIFITLVGKEKEILEIMNANNFNNDRLEIVNATEVIENDDSPVKSIRRKLDSSLVVGLNLLKDSKGDVFVSAGNTGALAVGSTLILGKIEGVDRPALTTMIPCDDSYALLCDAGANTNCRPVNFLQFGIMGYHYMRAVTEKDNPDVYLLNIGAEETKGSEVVKSAYQTMSNSTLNFKGNIEGREILSGKADVIVCDGFSGNIALKVMEGTALYINSLLKKSLLKSVFTKMSALILKDGLSNLKKKLDYTEYGGAPLLGVNGKVIKCHGSSNAKAVKNAITKFGIRFAQSAILEDLKRDMANTEINEFEDSPTV